MLCCPPLLTLSYTWLYDLDRSYHDNILSQVNYSIQHQPTVVFRRSFSRVVFCCIHIRQVCTPTTHTAGMNRGGARIEEADDMKNNNMDYTLLQHEKGMINDV